MATYLIILIQFKIQEDALNAELLEEAENSSTTTAIYE